MKQVQSKYYVAYYRVSTDRQGKSGLGLEAQQEAVRQHLNLGEMLVREYTEVESGKKSNRPKLVEALEFCKQHNATLLIAKLDRLGRNVSFIASLMDSGVSFTCCDNPHASKFMLHMLAAFAEHEREQISQRTKQALAAAKARGVKLGEQAKAPENRNGNRAEIFARTIEPFVREILRQGFTTYREIANTLNLKGIRSARGGKWSAASVYNLMQRLELMPQEKAV